MIVKEITDFIESFAPLFLQEAYDNAGLIIGDKNSEINSVLICIDITDEVINEALSKNCKLIISHHPLRWRSKIFHCQYHQSSTRNCIVT